jgi:hypothetical protein
MIAKENQIVFEVLLEKISLLKMNIEADKLTHYIEYREKEFILYIQKKSETSIVFCLEYIDNEFHSDFTYEVFFEFIDYLKLNFKVLDYFLPLFIIEKEFSNCLEELTAEEELKLLWNWFYDELSELLYNDWSRSDKLDAINHIKKLINKRKLE